MLGGARGVSGGAVAAGFSVGGLKILLDKKHIVYNNGCMLVEVSDEERLKEDGFGTEMQSRCTALYALLDKGRVVYIKKSRNVFAELGRHFRTRRRKRGTGIYGHSLSDSALIPFDKVLLRFCFLDELMQLEIDLVEKYRPEYNKPRRISPTIRLDYATLVAMTGLKIGQKHPNLRRRPLG